MKLKERLKMIDEGNCCINDTTLRIHYILKHLVYNKPEERELFVLGEFILELLEDIKTNSEGINNVISKILIN